VEREERAAPRPRQPTSLSPRRRAAFTAIAMALPFLLLTLVEVGLRLLDPRGGAPLFVRAPTGDGRLLVANPRVSERWFRGEGSPPAPRAEPFLAEKPRDGLRVVALGESSTYGFPYPATASFPRVLADMLRDVLPGRTVEVINLFNILI
jgi:hypothetical protein